jgi:hypothetical protein
MATKMMADVGTGEVGHEENLTMLGGRLCVIISRGKEGAAHQRLR